MSFYRLRRHYSIAVLLVFAACSFAAAQTDADADMMAKGLFCVGPTYSYSSWDHYWEGTHKRDNENLGTVSTQVFSVMGNYGISKKLNVLFNVPYVKTEASAGTLQGLKGWQDLSLFVKWMPLEKDLGKGNFRLIGVGAFSFPLSAYTPDFLPLSIGLHSKNVLARVMGHYQVKKLFVTGSGSYIFRSNITLDRTAYYTTEMHYTDEVEMPNVAAFALRTGYRSKHLLAEAVLNNWNTLGGFDITRNNMPFPSNEMNMTTAGVNLRWVPKPLPALTLNAGADYTIAGRNVGQATTVYGGVFYIFSFNRKTPAKHEFKSN